MVKASRSADEMVVLRPSLYTLQMGMLTYWGLRALCILFVRQGGRRFLSSPQWNVAAHARQRR
jgi:hypothetical protein